jgi:hypothetical protein
MTAIAVPGQQVALDKTGLATEAKQDDIITAVGLLATEVTAAAILADTNALVAKDFATETTLQKLREWPYATWDKQALVEAALTDTWTYTSGVTTVGTIVITYTDATKGTIQDVVYSPAQAV